MTGGTVRVVAVGQVEAIPDGDGVAYTAFRKRPVAGARRVGTLGVEGDHQADPTVHGGPEQAVYLYAFEHYAPWERELGRALELPAFGENLVVEGLTEDRVEIGDRLRVGGLVMEVTQPRMPCRKLSIVHGDRMMTRIFAERRRPGYYVRVLTPGAIEAGAAVERLPSNSGVSVLDVYRLRTGDLWDADLARRAVALPALGSSARSGLRRKLDAEERVAS